MELIELQTVGMAYEGETLTFPPLSFQVHRGEAIVLRGPNGAGKSTVLRIINGLLFPTQGHYFFMGTEITPKRMEDIKYSKTFHRHMAFLWQNPDTQLFCATVAEELAFGPLQLGLANTEIAQRVQDATELFGLQKLMHRAPWSLSGGEKKKVALASLLTLNPSIWTLDEPLAALDKASQTLLVQFLQALKAAGKTIIFASHDIALAEHLADREICLGE